jgi:hypothetical protein
LWVVILSDSEGSAVVCHSERSEESAVALEVSGFSTPEKQILHFFQDDKLGSWCFGTGTTLLNHRGCHPE